MNINKESYKKITSLNFWQSSIQKSKYNLISCIILSWNAVLSKIFKKELVTSLFILKTKL
jgi:hypothetical protein